MTREWWRKSVDSNIILWKNIFQHFSQGQHCHYHQYKNMKKLTHLAFTDVECPTSESRGFLKVWKKKSHLLV